MAFVSLSTLSLLLFFSSAAVDAADGGGFGFTVELIHRDSPKSPLYNPSETHYHRLANALRRSIRRKAASVATEATAEAPVYNNGGEYLMKLSVGTPPFPMMSIADTGSDIVWSQCAPCTNCYAQSAPIFDPRKSATYKKLPCSSPSCSFAGRRRSCSADRSECLYSIDYGDGSHSHGDMAVDTVTLGSTSGRHVAFPRTVIGCGHDNAGTFDANVSGIVGLGRGPASLVSQMGPSTGGKFSYCFVPIGSNSGDSSKLSFGSNAAVSGVGTVSTPIYEDETYMTFYTLNLEAISLGDKKFNFPSSSSPLSGGGNIIIDSGTTLTYLPEDFFADFGTAVSDAVNLQPARDPNQLLDFCFQSSADEDLDDVPPITVQFEGADVKLSRQNVFIRVADDVVCLAFAGGRDGGLSIYGNIAQNNFKVGYDVENMVVSFKPADCSAM